MSEIRIGVMAGDFIGPEITEAAKPVIELAGKIAEEEIIFEHIPISLEAYEASGTHLPKASVKAAKRVDAVLKGPVGGPPNSSKTKYENIEQEAVVDFRKKLGLYVNIRPVNTSLSTIIPMISPLKAEFAEGTDLVVVRDLSGDVYNGEQAVEPARKKGKISKRVFYERNDYTKEQVDRTISAGIDVARKRGDTKLTLVHKTNVLKQTGNLWKGRFYKLVSQADGGFETEYRHIDDAVQALMGESSEFQTIVTPNMFGDILSDQTAKLMGSIGLGAAVEIGRKVNVYGPVHGSAPNIEPQLADPIGMILASGLMFTHSFGRPDITELVENSVGNVLDGGHMPEDIRRKALKVGGLDFEPKLSGAKEFGELVCREMKKLAS